MEEIIEKIDLKNLDKANWKTYRFDQIAEKISETVDPGTTDLDIYIGLEHLDSESIHIKRRGTPADVSGGKLKCYPGDIIFGKRRAYQRKAAIVDFKGICSAHAFVLRAIPEVMDPKLFPFFLHSDLFMHCAVDISVGGLSPTINWGQLKEQEFFLPPKEQQAQLAELLWAMDELIEIDKKVNFHNKALLFSFIKDKIISGKFEKKRLGEIFKIRRGASPRPINDSKYFSENGRGWIRISDVTKSNKYLRTTEQNLSPLGVSCSVAVDEGDVIMSICATIGIPVIIQKQSCIHDGFVLFQSDQKEVGSEFLYYMLKYFEEYFKSKQQMGTQGNLNTTIVGNTEIPVPSKIEQVFFISALLKIEESASYSETRLSNSKALQKSLINQIF